MIYLDNAATTRVYPEVIEEMSKIYSVDFFNPSSTYSCALNVKRLVENSRLTIAKALSCKPGEVFFTSSATESNNWALNSGFKNKKGNMVVSSGEHACVYECAKNLKNKGFDVRFVNLDGNGLTDAESLINAVDENTCMVSVIHASNETGALNDIADLSRSVKSKNKKTLFHSDGVQAFLKTDNNVSRLGVDLYSISGHKVGAPKGIGALYISEQAKLRPFIFGGGQESGMRSGTENVAGIVGFGYAAEKFKTQFNIEKAQSNRRLLINELKKIPDTIILSENAPSNNSIVAFSAIGTKAEIIQTMCADEGVIIGRGSACAGRHSGNRVLSQMGLSQKIIDGALRIGLLPVTTEEEIITATKVIADNIEKLRGNRVG